MKFNLIDKFNLIYIEIFQYLVLKKKNIEYFIYLILYLHSIISNAYLFKYLKYFKHFYLYIYILNNKINIIA